MKSQYKQRGEFIICQIDDVLYSTDNLFWQSYYTGKPLPGDTPLTDKELAMQDIDMEVVTHKGKVIYRYPKEVHNDKR